MKNPDLHILSRHTSKAPKIKIAIADKHEIFRSGTQMTLNNYAQFEFLWQADSINALIHHIEAQSPDVLLMDLDITLQATIDAIISIRKTYPSVRIIILSQETTSESIAKIMQLDVSAFLSKDTDPAEIHTAINTCVKEEYYYNELVQSVILNKVKIRSKPQQAIEFTEREVTILKLIADDKSTTEISQEIFLSPRTVEAIRQGMKYKAGAKTTAGLVIYGMRNRLIS